MLFAPSRNVVTLLWVIPPRRLPAQHRPGRRVETIPHRLAWTYPGRAVKALAVDLRERIASLMAQARADLAELVAIPSVADSRQYPPEECARAARWVRDAFAGAGFSDAWLAEMADGSQAVL